MYAHVYSQIGWRLSDEPLAEGEDPADFPMVDREKVKATIFLGYTSNMISSGIRECIRFLAQHRMIDCIVTSAGGIEEDIMKCIAPHYMGDFHHSGVDLRLRGLNRIGNLIVPNTNYIGFEEFITPLLDSMLDEQSSKNIKWTPSKIIHRLGLEIQNEDSVYYWCSKNNIPVFCPAITDGSLGDMIYFHSQQHKDNHLRIDIVEGTYIICCY
jgi:deoxyhypusine synthase